MINAILLFSATRVCSWPVPTARYHTAAWCPALVYYALKLSTMLPYLLCQYPVLGFCHFVVDRIVVYSPSCSGIFICVFCELQIDILFLTIHSFSTYILALDIHSPLHGEHSAVYTFGFVAGACLSGSLLFVILLYVCVLS